MYITETPRITSRRTPASESTRLTQKVLKITARNANEWAGVAIMVLILSVATLIESLLGVTGNSSVAGLEGSLAIALTAISTSICVTMYYVYKAADWAKENNI